MHVALVVPPLPPLPPSEPPAPPLVLPPLLVEPPVALPPLLLEPPVVLPPLLVEPPVVLPPLLLEPPLDVVPAEAPLPLPKPSSFSLEPPQATRPAVIGNVPEVRTMLRNNLRKVRSFMVRLSSNNDASNSGPQCASVV
jgi:hypothetical protein